MHGNASESVYVLDVDARFIWTTWLAKGKRQFYAVFKGRKILRCAYMFEAWSGIHYERGLYSDLKIVSAFTYTYVHIYIYISRAHFTACVFLRYVTYTRSFHTYICIRCVTPLRTFPVAKRYLRETVSPRENSMSNIKWSRYTVYHSWISQGRAIILAGFLPRDLLLQSSSIVFRLTVNYIW